MDFQGTHQYSTCTPFHWNSELSMRPYPWFPHLQNGRSYGPYHKKFKVNEPICSQKKTKYIQKMIKLSLAHMDIHMISNITLIQSNFKWRTCLLPSDFIKVINIMVNLKSSKATCNTQSNSTCFSKTTKWKSARWIWKKKRTRKE
jgi:hypothetical protein